MTDTLFLHLEHPEASASLEGRLLDADGAVLSGPLRGTLTELVAAYPGARVVALIPAADALVTRVRLPKISSAKLRHSLPFALEEQLATDLEGQHFALGRSHETVSDAGTAALDVPVAVIGRERLATWLELLRAAGAEPAALHLAEDCIAAKPGDVIVWLKRDAELYLRAPSGVGAAATIEELPVVLDLLLGDSPRQSLGLQVFADAELGTDLRARVTTQFEALAASLARVSWLPNPGDTTGWLAAQWRLAEPINLLQGEFTPKRTGGLIAGRWRLAAALAAAWLLVYLVDLGLEWRSALAAERQLDAQLLQAAQTSAPGIRSIDELVGKIGDSPRTPRGAALLQSALVDLVAAGVAPNSLKSIALVDQALRVEFLAGGAVEPLVAALRARGWQVELSASDGGAAVVSLLRTDEAGRP